MLEPQLGMSVQGIVDWGAYAERRGYGYILRSDHLLPTDGDRHRDSPECWVTLGILAATTNKIKFGPMVSPIGFRNPALLAQMACNLHAYSRGRLMMGLGAGWSREEYLAKGYEFPKLHVRHNQMIEALKIISPLIEGKPVNFHGRHYTAKTVSYPYKGSRMRLILGGWSPFVRRAVREYADEWNLFNGLPTDFKKIRKRLDSSRTKRKIEISRAGPFLIAETSDRLQKMLKRKSGLLRMFELPLTVDGLRKREILCGTVDEFTSQLNQLEDAGVNRFYFQILDPDDKQMVDLLTHTLKAL